MNVSTIPPKHRAAGFESLLGCYVRTSLVGGAHGVLRWSAKNRV